jgi:hypothetical protein
MDKYIYSNIQNGFRDLIMKFEWQYFVTGNLNRETNWLGAKRLLRDWHGGVDRRLLGGRWHKTPKKRTFFVAAFEGAETNYHWHMMLRLNCDRAARFEKIAPVVWQEIVPSGSMDIQKVRGDDGASRASTYATKELWKQDRIEALVLSTEFQTQF